MPKKEADGKSVAKKSTVKKTQKKKATKRVAAKTVKKPTPKKAATKKMTKKVAKKTSTAKKSNKLPQPQSKPNNRQEVQKIALEQLFKKPDNGEAVLNSEKETTLPSNMSVRSIEKTLAIHTLLSDSVAEKVRRGAYGLSFVFILFGSLYSLQQVVAVAAQTNTQLANLIDSTSSSSKDISETVKQSIEPELLRAPQFPQILDSKDTFTFSLLNADRAEVIVQNIKTGNKITIEGKALSSDKYEFSVSPEVLDVGSYEVRIAALTRYGVTDFPAGRFTVSSNSEIEINEESDRPQTEENIESEEAQPDSVVDNKTFDLVLTAKTIKAPTMLSVLAPANITNVKLFGLREDSYTTQPLGGTVRKTEDGWRVFFDVKNIPNGTYELFVTGLRNGVEVKSVGKEVVIAKPSLATSYATAKSEDEDVSQATTSSQQQVQSVLVVSEGQPVQAMSRNFSEITLLPEIDRESDTESVVTKLLQSERIDLENLLRNYSVAAQSNNEITKRLAVESLDAYVARLQEKDEATVASAQGKIADRVLSLRNKIDTFETLRRSKSSEATAIDSDGDGISDLDERTLFNTDPDNPDTDEDGVIDGIEVMRGYNPADGASEANVMYESPRESIGLTYKDDLRVVRVSPYVVAEPDAGKVVQASIVGQALPNSYVTLYIFSTPTIITVKTDDTGAFEYIFTNELEDGKHDVYVAMTDNAGKIVAQSEPFTFVKEAEAFTTGSFSDGPAGTSDYILDNQYSLALGLGVLSLGVVLFMLGIGLRREEPVLVTGS